MKVTKQLRKQAEKAERRAQAIPDPEAAQSMMQLAIAYRAQAAALKKKSKQKSK